MDEIEHALKHPYFQAFMGRRSVPMNADFILDVVDKGVIDTLKNYEWQAAKWYQKKYAREIAHLEVYADSDLISEKAYTFRKDLVRSFSQKERQFLGRYESKMNVNVIQNSSDMYSVSEHDIWSSVGE